MKKLLGRFGALATVLVCAAMFAQTSAYAAPGAAVLAVEGGGTISPGLTATPAFQSGSFSGTVAGVAAAVPGVAVGLGTCNFPFSSTIAETAAQGQGTASGTCSGGTVGSAIVNCSLNYTRVGALVVIVITACTATVSGPTGSGSTTLLAGVGVFAFVPTSGNGATSPVTSYALAGVSAGVGQ